MNSAAGVAERGRWVIAFAVFLALIQAASRLFLLYRELRPGMLVLGLAAGAALLLFGKRTWIPALAVLIATPFLVQYNRRQWTTYWDDLKPALAALPAGELAELAFPEGSYYAGHVVAAGNPIRPAVRCLTPQEIEASTRLPRYLAVLLTPGSSPGWEARYGADLARRGYQIRNRGRNGVIFVREFR